MSDSTDTDKALKAAKVPGPEANRAQLKRQAKRARNSARLAILHWYHQGVIDAIDNIDRHAEIWARLRVLDREERIVRNRRRHYEKMMAQKREEAENGRL